MTEWKKCTLGDLGQVVTGKTPSTKQSDFWNGNIPFVTPKDIQESKHIYNTERYISHMGMLSVNGSILPSNAVCVSCIGNIGYVSITTQECVSNQQINSIIVNDDNDYNFVYYIIKGLWKFFKNYEGQSTALSILNKTQFSKIEVNVPVDKNVQVQIATLLNSIDEKIEENVRINKNLEQQAITIFLELTKDKAVNGILNDILIESRKSTIKVNDAKNIINGEFPFFTSGKTILTYPYFLVDDRNIYLNTGGTADVKYYIGKAAYSTDTWCIKGKHTYTDYIYLLLKNMVSELDQIYFEGSALKHLQKDKLRNLPIYIPSEKEIGLFNQTIVPIFNLLSKNTVQNKSLCQIRDTLLPRLMSGELDMSEIDI